MLRFFDALIAVDIARDEKSMIDTNRLLPNFVTYAITYQTDMLARRHCTEGESEKHKR